MQFQRHYKLLQNLIVDNQWFESLVYKLFPPSFRRICNPAKLDWGFQIPFSIRSDCKSDRTVVRFIAKASRKNNLRFRKYTYFCGLNAKTTTK